MRKYCYTVAPFIIFPTSLSHILTGSLAGIEAVRRLTNPLGTCRLLYLAEIYPIAISVQQNTRPSSSDGFFVFHPLSMHSQVNFSHYRAHNQNILILDYAKSLRNVCKPLKTQCDKNKLQLMPTPLIGTLKIPPFIHGCFKMARENVHPIASMLASL